MLVLVEPATDPRLTVALSPHCVTACLRAVERVRDGQVLELARASASAARTEALLATSEAALRRAKAREAKLEHAAEAKDRAVSDALRLATREVAATKAAAEARVKAADTAAASARLRQFDDEGRSLAQAKVLREQSRQHSWRPDGNLSRPATSMHRGSTDKGK